jgi:hypothetical protein
MGLCVALTCEPTSGEVAPEPWTWLMGVLAEPHSVDGGGSSTGGGGDFGVGSTPLHSAQSGDGASLSLQGWRTHEADVLARHMYAACITS